MSEKDEIAKAMAKMEAEAAKIETIKNREQQLRRKHQKQTVVEEKNRQQEIHEDNKEQHKEMIESLQFKGIFIAISCLVTLIYVSSLKPHQRANLTEDVVLWGLAAGMVLVAALKR
jgi:cation transport ATPase